MKLRDYQDDCVDALFAYWESGGQNPIIALPTGTGKSLVIAEFVRRALLKYPGTNIVILAHVKELIEQNFKTLIRHWPTAPAGIFSSGLKRKDVGRAVTFAGIGTIASVPHWFKPDLVLIDECHTVSPQETTTYRKVIAVWEAQDPTLKVAGLSATPFRLGQGMLVEPGGIFTDICFDATTRDGFNWFIAEGYLKPLIPKQTRTKYDISSVRIASTGDYNARDLQAAVDVDSKTREAVAEMLVDGEDRKHWLVFAAGIEHAKHVAAILVENGIDAVAVHSKTSDADRDEAVRAFKAGEIRALVNNGIFTTGFDFPGIDYIAVLRHTTSASLWIQVLGRGTRPVWLPGYDISTREGRLACIAAGSPNCRVSDFAKNTERLGPVNDVKKPVARKKKDDTPGDIPVKACPLCLAYNHASARTCCECGAEFVFKTKLEGTASNKALIAGSHVAEEPIEEWFDVETVTYSKHTPWKGKRSMFGKVVPSLRVTYNCVGLRNFSEYICLQHGGMPEWNAKAWWANSLKPEFADSTDEVPTTIDAALAVCDRLRAPSRIRVWVNRPNPKIQYHEFQ